MPTNKEIKILNIDNVCSLQAVLKEYGGKKNE